MDANAPTAANGHTAVPEYTSHRPDLPVRIDGRDYAVREMDDATQSEYTEVMARRFKTNRRGRVVKRDMRGLRAELISRCLYDAEGHRVPRAMVVKWGARLQNALFDKCQEHNGLTDDFEGDEGKDLENEETTTGGDG